MTVIGVGEELQTYNGVNAAALLREVLAKLGAIIAVGGTRIVKANQEQLEFYQGASRTRGKSQPERCYLQS